MYVTRASDSVLTASLPLTQTVLHLTQTVLLLPTPPPNTPLLQTQLRDFIVWLVAFVVTLFAGIELGLAAAIGLALVIVIIESAFPHTAMLGRVERTTVRGACWGWCQLLQLSHVDVCVTTAVLRQSIAPVAPTGCHAAHDRPASLSPSHPLSPLPPPCLPPCSFAPSFFPWQVYRNIEQYPHAETVPGVLVVRLDAPVYFANVQHMEDKLVEYEADALRCVWWMCGNWGRLSVPVVVFRKRTCGDFSTCLLCNLSVSTFVCVCGGGCM